MVKIVESARFNRESLLGDLAEDAYRLDHPGHDYITASKLVWNAMRNHAIKKASPMTGDGNESGWHLKGMGPRDAVVLLWPGISKAELLNAANAVRRLLRQANMAVCLEQGRAYSLGEWWVADEWIAPTLARPGQLKARKFAIPKKKGVRREAVLAPNFPRKETETGLSLDGETRVVSEETIYQTDESIVIEKITAFVHEMLESFIKDNAKLRTDNDQLRVERDKALNRIDLLKTAIGGLDL